MKKPKLSPKQYAKRDGANCPNCGGGIISSYDVETDQGCVYQNCSCDECQAEWTDVYSLVGYSGLNVPAKVAP